MGNARDEFWALAFTIESISQNWTTFIMIGNRPIVLRIDSEYRKLAS